MLIKPLGRDPLTGYIIEAQSGDTLATPTLGVYEEYVTLFENAEVNTCCALIEYTAIPINSANLPILNYRSSPSVDCILLESGTTGQTVKAALTHGKLYTTTTRIDYSNSDILYLGRNSLLTTTTPSLLTGDRWSVIVGRLINHYQFVFDPQLPIDFNSVIPDGNIPPVAGHNNTFLYTDGNTKFWQPIRLSSLTPDPEITFFEPDVAVLEVGQNSIYPSFTAVYNEAVYSASLIDDEYNIEQAIIDFNDFNSNNVFSFDEPKTVNFTLQAYLSSVINKITTIKWQYRKFWGTSSDLIGIETLHFSALSDTLISHLELVSASGEYLWFAAPVAMGRPVFSVGGIDGGFYLHSIIQYTNDYGLILNYNIYRSYNHSLGIINIEVHL